MKLSDPRLGEVRYIGFTGIGTSQQNLGLNVPSTGTAKVVTPDNFFQVVESLNVQQHTAAGTVTLQITNGTVTFNVKQINFAAAEATYEGADGFDFHIVVPNGYWLTAATSADTCDVIAVVSLQEGGDYS